MNKETLNLDFQIIKTIACQTSFPFCMLCHKSTFNTSIHHILTTQLICNHIKHIACFLGTNYISKHLEIHAWYSLFSPSYSTISVSYPTSVCSAYTNLISIALFYFLKEYLPYLSQFYLKPYSTLYMLSYLFLKLRTIHEYSKET